MSILYKADIWSLKCKPENKTGKNKKNIRHAVSPADDVLYLFKVPIACPVNDGRKFNFGYCSIIKQTETGLITLSDQTVRMVQSCNSWLKILFSMKVRSKHEFDVRYMNIQSDTMLSKTETFVKNS